MPDNEPTTADTFNEAADRIADTGWQITACFWYCVLVLSILVIAYACIKAA